MRHFDGAFTHFLPKLTHFFMFWVVFFKQQLFLCIDKPLQIPQRLSGYYMTLGWVCVFVSCIWSLWREGSPPWQGPEPRLPPPLCPAVNGAFFSQPGERQKWFTTNDQKPKEQPCSKYAPSSTSLSRPLSRGPSANPTRPFLRKKRSTKLLTSPLFCILSIWSNARPQRRDREISWPSDNTNTVVKQRGWFISSGLWNAPRRETKMALLTDSPVNDILWHHLGHWMCVCAKATDEFET